MKLKPLLATILWLVLYSFSSCKKDNSNTTNNSGKLKMYIEDARNTSFGEIDSFNVTYDGSNRITGLISDNLKTLYSYSNNSFTLDLYTYGQLSVHEIFYINSSSLVDSTLQYNDTNDSTTEKYFYNGKLLTKLITYDYSKLAGAQIFSEDDYAYDNNNNLIKQVNSDGYGNINTISTITYTSKLFGFSINPIYLPVFSKNLPATQTQTDGSGNPIATVTYTYIFDSSGRVTQETDALDNGESVIKSYVYY